MSRNRQILWIALAAGITGAAVLLAQVPTTQETHSGSPSVAPHSASAQDFERWRTQIRQALFIDYPPPALTPRSYGNFFPAPGVIAERVIYGTSYGMRVPAIVTSIGN